MQRNQEAKAGRLPEQGDEQLKPILSAKGRSDPALAVALTAWQKKPENWNVTMSPDPVT